MREIWSFNLVLVIQLSDCLHLETNASRMNIRRQRQDIQNLSDSIPTVPPSIPLVTPSYLQEKLDSKSILPSKRVSQRMLKEDLHKRRRRSSLSITNSFDVLRSRLLNSIKMGYGTFGENTNQNRGKEQEDRRGLNNIG